MDREKYKLGLSYLNQSEFREGEILYWWCKGKKKEDIKTYVDSNDTTVWYRMQSVVDKLNNAGVESKIDRGAIVVEDDFRDFLFEAIGDPPQFDPWPPIVQQVTGFQDLDPDGQEESSGNGGDGGSNNGDDNGDEADGGNPWLIVGIIGAAIVIVLLLLFGSWAYGEISQRISSGPGDETSTPIVIVAPTAEEREVTRIVEVAAEPTIFVVTATLSPDTPGPSATSTDTPIPTNTSTPKPSRTPTATATPIPPMELLFYDDFSDGIDERWNIASGNSIIENGVLRAVEQDLRLIFAGPLPPRYNIELGYDRGYIRVIIAESLGLVLGWNVWDRVDGTRYYGFSNFEGISENSTVRLEVDGDKHTLFANGVKIHELIYNTPSDGTLELQILTSANSGITDIALTVP